MYLWRVTTADTEVKSNKKKTNVYGEPAFIAVALAFWERVERTS